MTPETPEQLLQPRPDLFLVIRSSSLDDDVPPCEGAKQYQVKRVDRRSVDDPKKIPLNRGTDGDWYTRGENHRVENGMICRDVGWKTEWFVEIPDIMAFVRRYGQCVVSHRDGYPCIEIYDDYRE